MCTRSLREYEKGGASQYCLQWQGVGSNLGFTVRELTLSDVMNVFSGNLGRVRINKPDVHSAARLVPEAIESRRKNIRTKIKSIGQYQCKLIL
jgi:hypothetical protein